MRLNHAKRKRLASPYCSKTKADGPFVLGVPTGWSVHVGGYKQLDVFEKTTIDIAFDNIRRVLRENPNIHTVLFSCDANDSTMIGQGIFKVCDNVIQYISENLMRLCHLSITPDDIAPKTERVSISMCNRIEALETKNAMLQQLVKKTYEKRRKTEERLKELVKNFEELENSDREERKEKN